MSIFRNKKTLKRAIDEQLCKCGISTSSGNGFNALTTDVVTGPNGGVAIIQPKAVTNSKMADMPAKTIKGNDLNAAGSSKDLTVAEAKALLGIPLYQDEGSDISGVINKINFVGNGVTASLTGTTLNVNVPGGGSGSGDITYSNNGAIIVASGSGVTFTRTTPSVWDINIPAGVILKSYSIYSNASQNPGANVTIRHNYASNSLTNQGLATANPPNYLAFNMASGSQLQVVTGGSASSAFRPSINAVSGGNIEMLCQLGSSLTAVETLIKGIF